MEKPQGRVMGVGEEGPTSYLPGLVPSRGNEQTGCVMPKGCEWIQMSAFWLHVCAYMCHCVFAWRGKEPAEKALGQGYTCVGP